MYKKLCLLKSQKRETHTFDASLLDDTNKKLENYLVSIPRFPAADPVIALLDSATTHTILRSPEYFKFEGHRATWHTSDIVTIAGRRNFHYREGQARVLLPGGTPVLCERAMYSPNAPRSLISYRDLRANGIHITTTQVNGEEVLELRRGLSVLATAKGGANALYEMKIKFDPKWINADPGGTLNGSKPSLQYRECGVSSRSSTECGKSTKCGVGTSELKRPLVGATNPGGSKLKTELGPRHLASSAYSVEIPARIQMWHNRLGHPGTTMFRRMIPTLAGHTVCLSDAGKLEENASYSQGKFIKQPSKWKLPSKLPEPLERLQGDICGSIVPSSGSFHYFLVLVDASGRHAEVSLLSTRNMAFPKLLAMILKIRAHYPDANIKTLRMDNVGEFKSQNFEDYCVASGIALTYTVPYEHSQNGLAEAYIKKIQLVVQPLLIHAKLPSSLWGHAVLHVAAFLRLRPTLLHTQTPLELV